MIIIIKYSFNIIVIYIVTRLTGISQAMLRTEELLSVILLDWVDIVLAEVSCTTPFPSKTTVTLCLIPFAYIRK